MTMEAALKISEVIGEMSCPREWETNLDKLQVRTIAKLMLLVWPPHS